MKRAIVILLALCGIAAAEPSAQFKLGERGTPHAGVPFTLQLIADGFDEQPQPEAPKLDISGAHVTFAGVSPSVMHSMQNINGRVTQSTVVRWVFQWHVDVAKSGRVHIPSVTITQGSKRATAEPGDLDLDEVPTTDAMKLELALPERPVFVGETFEAKITWLFRSQPEDQTFSVPMMSLDDFTISAPPATDQRKALQLQAGTKQLQLPFELDQADVNGQKWNRVVLRFYAAPRKPGKIDVPPASVVAALAVGRPDFFGNAQTRLFRTSDAAHSLEVKPLPETDKPASFSGAVGSQFSIAVHASRSVVQLGEPVDLDITIKSAERLDTLALPRLDTLLPKDQFTVPPDPPTGELSDDGKTKTFKVTAQVTGPATEIPALAFSYFDPVRSQYQTIHSDPIALSVKGGSIVGANDVVASAKSTKPAPQQPQTEDLTRVGADLALSSPDAAGKRPLGGALLWALVGLLYAVPLVLLALRTWQLRTQTSREEAAEVRTARRRAEDELARAAKQPARDVAGPLTSALRTYARAVERDASAVIAQIETESFAPGAASEPLSQATRDRVADQLRSWGARRAAVPKAAIVVIVLAALAPHARADSLGDGRKAYQDAMTLTDASARKAAFARASTLLGDAVRADPDHPELLADWGNAALAAGDIATATLAYRRALALDGDNARARHNLAWLRSRQPELLRPADDASGDSLFFFHTWPRARRLLVGAIAFAAAILLLVPWRGRRRRAFVGLALLPAAVWIAMVVSLAIEDRRAGDAVILEDAVLRAADSMGAPAAMAQALPKGAEVTISERRDAWTKVRVASGTAGWVPSGSVEAVARP